MIKHQMSEKEHTEKYRSKREERNAYDNHRFTGLSPLLATMHGLGVFHIRLGTRR